MGYTMLSPDPVYSLLIFLLAFASAIILTALSLRHFSFGASLVMTVFFWQAWTVEPLPGILILIGISVYPEDIVYSVLALAGMIRLAQFGPRKYLRSPYMGWIFFGMLILVAFIRGVVAFGPGAAGVEVRKFFYFFSGTLYFGTFALSSTKIKSISKIWFCVSILLVLCAFLRWYAELLGLPMAEKWSSRGAMRVLSAAETFFLAQALLVCLYLRMGRGIAFEMRHFAILLLPVVLLLQHRTVWVVLLVSIFFILLREGMLRKRVLLVISTGSVAIAVVLLIVVGDHEMDKLIASAANLSTWEWRVSGWKALIGEHMRNPIDILIGKPFGAGYGRFIGPYNNLVEVSPHNFYIELLLRLGLVGFSCFLFIYKGLLQYFWLYQQNTQGPAYFYSRLFSTLALTHLVYFITYSPNHEQGILLGIMFSLVFALQSENIELTKEKTSQTYRKRRIWQN
jgi:O-antigen ligase